MTKQLGAVDCWIAGCAWYQNEPPGTRYTGDERDDLRVVHMAVEHTPSEVTTEVDRRIAELLSDGAKDYTREQIEDRNSIIYIMRGHY